MDNLTLDAETLFAIADVIDGYCAKQRETVNVYYAQIMALESEWRDDETFGGIAEEIRALKNKAVEALDEIYNTYPKYFRNKAREIMERPVFESASSNGYAPSNDVPNMYSGVNSAPYRSSGSAYSGSVLSNAQAPASFEAASGSTGSTESSLLNDSSSVGVKMPSGTVPNSFSKTKEQWHEDYYTETYNAPLETGQHLNCDQGKTPEEGGEGVKGFCGTCGLVSIENILRLAGVKITEADVVKFASTHKSSIRYLCTVGKSPDENGGTYASDRQAILKHYGIDSRVEYTSDVSKIAKYISEGRGVIASVDANVLWYGRARSTPEYHAITVTSVERDSYTKEITAFYICDSGSGNGDNARKIPVDVFSDAIERTGELNVTELIIR